MTMRIAGARRTGDRRRARDGGSPGPHLGAPRAERTAMAVLLGGGWVWPHWLERQLDAGSPAFVPLTDPASLVNLTARSWSVLGTVGARPRATVDPRGLVTPEPGGWSLDWWVGAEDRWHLPSREAAVRQRLVDGAPVVETAMRVPGGDILHRAFAVRPAAGNGPREVVVVEIENATPVPVAIALAVRPCNPEGVAVVERIELGPGPNRAGASANGPSRVVTADGRVALLLPKAPNRVAASTFATGDVAADVLGGRAGTTFPAGLRCDAGLASAAFVYPLPHRATLSVLLPLAGTAGRAPGRDRARPVAAPAWVDPAAVPGAGQVANGWKAHAGRGLRLVLPDPRLAACVEANRRWLLVLHGDDATEAGAVLDPVEVATLAGALDRFGYRDEAAGLVASLPDHQGGDGSFPTPSGELAGTGAALHAVGEHWRLTRDAAALEGMAPVVAAAVEHIERRRGAGRGVGRPPELAGLLPAGPDRGRPGPPAVRYADDFWSLRGLFDAAEVLDGLGELDAATDARARAEHLGADLDASLAVVAARLGTAAIPAGPTLGGNGAPAASLVAGWPLRLLPADDARLAATVAAVRDGGCHGPAVATPAGLDPVRTLQLATVELEVGDPRALDRLDWLLSVASTCWTWPQVVHPRLGTGSAGDGHAGAVAAELLSFVRNLLVRETPDSGLALCSLVPATWLGQPLEVHGAPTHHGTVSFALRWHGDRPALLWELEPHPGVAAVRLTAPGLDRSWSTAELRGDALLGPVTPPPQAEVVPGTAAGDTPATPVQLSQRRPRDGG